MTIYLELKKFRAAIAFSVMSAIWLTRLSNQSPNWVLYYGEESCKIVTGNLTT